MNYRVGIDIGGTFTDIVLLEDDGKVITKKVLSTPDDYNRCIVKAIESILKKNETIGENIREVIHGTTIATNAILEHKGAKTGLITTKGFRDILEIRRLRMPVLFDLKWQKPKTLVRREFRFEIEERINHLGDIKKPIDIVQATKTIHHLLDKNIEAIAVCLLNAYANSEHEQLIFEIIRSKNKSIPISLSSEILPEIKEYERTSTTVVNAYLVPSVQRYLKSMQVSLINLGIKAPLRIMQSSGGTMGVNSASNRPIQIIESGPASGVVGAAELAKKLGYVNLQTFDMGGTTAKASVVENGFFDRVNSLHVGGGINMSGRLLTGGGYHVSAPAIDIAEVGAGGGSLVKIDSGGSLQVGPESAGSTPGPVCYNLGGSIPTVTDANLILGYINPESLVGGALSLRKDLSIKAINEQIASPLGISLEEAAYGIHIVADSLMARALKSISSERGRDPREFALMAFGGNGGVHAATLAQSLEMNYILIPPIAGVFSALGLLFPETEHNYVQSYKRKLNDLGIAEVESRYLEMEKLGRSELVHERFSESEISYDRFADLCYLGSNTVLSVKVSSGTSFKKSAINNFSKAHEKLYGFKSDDNIINVINIRLVAQGKKKKSRVPKDLKMKIGNNKSSMIIKRPVYFGKKLGWVDTPQLLRSNITNNWLTGPIVIDEHDTTTVIPPFCKVRLKNWNILEITLKKM